MIPWEIKSKMKGLSNLIHMYETESEIDYDYPIHHFFHFWNKVKAVQIRTWKLIFLPFYLFLLSWLKWFFSLELKLYSLSEPELFRRQFLQSNLVSKTESESGGILLDDIPFHFTKFNCLQLSGNNITYIHLYNYLEGKCGGLEVQPTKTHGESNSNYKVSEKSRALIPNRLYISIA